MSNSAMTARLQFAQIGEEIAQPNAAWLKLRVERGKDDVPACVKIPASDIHGNDRTGLGKIEPAVKRVECPGKNKQ